MPTTPGGRGLGVVFTPPDPRTWAYPHARSPLLGAPMDIDLRDKMQPVGNQGQLGSCTGWAGTAALEAKLQDGQQRSPLYVYYYDRLEDGTPPGSDAGSSMLGLCKALKDYGAPPDDRWLYQPGYFSTEPSQYAKDGATRIDSYYQIQGTGLALLQGLWAALANGETPALALNIYAEFERMGADGKAPMPASGSAVLGGHAITACMWFNDNSAPGGYGWVGCQNSWGKGFGDGGYVYLPAAYFTSGIVREAWVIAVTAPVPPPPVPEPDVDVDQINAKLDQIWDMVGEIQDDRCPWDSSKATYQRSMARICDQDAGPIKNVVEQIKELLPKVVPPTPVSGSISGVAVTYSGHDPARDCYLGYSDEQVQWGPHHGIPLIAPADGVVSLYAFPTPLATIQAAPPEYAVNYARLFGGNFVCGMKPEDLIAAGQTMYFVLFVPNAPLMGLRAMWFGHARGNAKVGPVTKGEWFGESWDSGVHFESVGINARAAHVHCCASATGTLTMNGDVDGLQAATAMGWKVQFVGNGPGPDQYYSGAYCAGRLLSDFTSKGHIIPSVPS